jgi:hypothetical protein
LITGCFPRSPHGLAHSPPLAGLPLPRLKRRLNVATPLDEPREIRLGIGRGQVRRRIWREHCTRRANIENKKTMDMLWLVVSVSTTKQNKTKTKTKKKTS